MSNVNKIKMTNFSNIPNDFSTIINQNNNYDTARNNIKNNRSIEIFDFEDNGSISGEIVSIINDVEDFRNEIGCKVSNGIQSIINGIDSWKYDIDKWLKEDALPILKNIGSDITSILSKTGATVALGAQSLLEGIGQFGEAIFDIFTITGTAIVSIFTGLYDGGQALYGLATGTEWESATGKLWDNTMSFVSESYVTNWFDNLYDNTSYGNWIKENSFGFETVRSVGSGIGYVAGVTAITLLTFGLGGAALGGAGAASGIAVTAGQTAAVAGIAGVGKGAQDSWADGATLAEGLVTGGLTGAWEGLQFYLGAKIGTSNLFNGNHAKILNSLSRVALDGLDGGVEGFIQPLIASIYKDGYTNDLGEYIEFTNSDNFSERYGEIFNDYGSWQNVFTQAAIGSIGSTIGEVSDLTRFLKNNNDTNINVEIMDTLKNVSINNDESITRDLMFAIGAYLDKYGGDPEKVIAHLKKGISENNYNVFSNHNGARNYIKEYDFQQLSSVIDTIEKTYQSNKIPKDVFNQYQYWDREMVSTNFDNIFDKINSSNTFEIINSQIDTINKYAENGRYYILNVNKIDDIPPDFWNQINEPALLKININGKIKNLAEVKAINLKQELNLAEKYMYRRFDKYSDYTFEQVMESDRDYQKLCNLFLELAPNDNVRIKLENILYKGGDNDFCLSSKICNKDNPRIEAQRRISMAKLLIKNPETYDVLVQKKINLFHGTNANALPEILKYGLNSHAESQRIGIDVITGEKWSRGPNNIRDFVSFTDSLDVAAGYSSMGSEKSINDLSFEVIIGTTVDDVNRFGTTHVSSDVVEVGVKNKLPLEGIKVICVPTDKVDFVKRIIGNSSNIEVLAIDGAADSLYWNYNLENPYNRDFNKLKSDLTSTPKGKIFGLEEIKNL